VDDKTTRGTFLLQTRNSAIADRYHDNWHDGLFEETIGTKAGW